LGFGGGDVPKCFDLVRVVLCPLFWEFASPLEICQCWVDILKNLDIKFGCHLSKLFKDHKNCDIRNDILKLMDIEKKSNIRPTLKFTLHIKKFAL
jgi:hypothetical protein